MRNKEGLSAIPLEEFSGELFERFTGDKKKGSLTSYVAKDELVKMPSGTDMLLLEAEHVSFMVSPGGFRIIGRDIPDTSA